MPPRPTLDAPREVDNVQGAALIVRREVLERIGLLDEGYFMYTEEVDLCQRIRDAGWRVYWAPQSQVVHHGGQSTQLVSERMFLELYGSKVRYFRKHFGHVATLVYKLVLATAAIVRLVIAPLAVLGIWQPRAHRQRSAANYLQLLRVLSRM